MKKPIATALLLAVTSLIGTVSTARATSFVMVRDADLADQAAAVVEVRIEAVENARTTRPTTDYRVAVERLIAGTVAQRSLLIRVPGGTGPGGKRLAIWGAPQFTPGERALLFLARESDGSYRVLHLMLGAFHEVKSAGKSLAVRDLGDAIELPRSKGAIDPRERGPRDLSQFAQWIADRAAGRRRAADYFAERSGLGGISNVDQSFTLQQRGPRKLRWFDFDTGGTVSWRADAAGQPGVAGGGLAEFQHALSQWTADSATPIRFLYGGTMAAGAGGGLNTFDGINEIAFNRPLSDPFRCDTGGVLAVGGPWYDADARTRWNGEDYIPILGADIVVNAGIACYFETDPHSSAAAEEIFGHELGHTLGLGHSCGDDASGPCRGHAAADDALMRAFVHDDGRGARLTADDRAAIASLYGTGGSTAPNPALPGPSGLAVSLDLAGSSAVAGEIVTLRARFSGPAQGARWTIGEDGLALSGTACEPGVYCARYLFPQAGIESVRVVVADGHGKSAEAAGQLEVKAGPAGSAGTATLGRREALLADAAGPEGTRTDLWLFNPSDSPALVEISFQARGIGAVTPHRRVTVEEGRSVHLMDVFALLGAAPGRGSLAVASLPTAGRVEAPAVLALARPVTAPRGTAGTAGTTSAAADGFGPLIGSAEQESWSALPKAIAGILTGSGLSSSLLVASLDSSAGQVRVELLDAAGAVVGAAAIVSLGPGVNRLQPLARLFPAAAGRKGPFTARLTSSGIRFAAAVELAMARSGDRLVLAAVDSGPGGSAGNVWIPRVARGGETGAPVSGLTVFNGATAARELVIELLPRGVGTKVPPAARRTVAALATLRIDDVLRELFGLTQGVGALRVRWSGGQGPAPLVASHALAGAAEPGGPRYGLRVEGYEVTDAVVRQGFGFGAEQTTSARSSYGAVNLGESAVTLRLTVHAADGGELASRSLGLAARQHLERDLTGLFPTLGEGDGWSVETEVLAGGPVLPYLLRRDATGDLDVATAREMAPAN